MLRYLFLSKDLVQVQNHHTKNETLRLPTSEKSSLALKPCAREQPPIDATALLVGRSIGERILTTTGENSTIGCLRITFFMG